MDKDVSDFINWIKEFGIELSESQLSQFEKYFSMLVEKNKVMNLTSIVEHREVYVKHFLDSLSLVKEVQLNKPLRVLDLGTGAGFPGIPLKLAFPELEITLMDSLNKRINFLNEVIDELGLKNITAVHYRAEEAAAKTEYREKYDLCVSRAVARLASLSEFCLPFVKQGGMFIPYKAGNSEEEINEAKIAVSTLGGKIRKVSSFTLPETDIERTLIIIDKAKQTPTKYPRAGGKPLKAPLGVKI